VLIALFIFIDIHTEKCVVLFLNIVIYGLSLNKQFIKVKLTV